MEPVRVGPVAGLVAPVGPVVGLATPVGPVVGLVAPGPTDLPPAEELPPVVCLGVLLAPAVELALEGALDTVGLFVAVLAPTPTLLLGTSLELGFEVEVLGDVGTRPESEDFGLSVTVCLVRGTLLVGFFEGSPFRCLSSTVRVAIGFFEFLSLTE